MAMLGYFKVKDFDGSATEKGFEKFTHCFEADIETFFEYNNSTHKLAGDLKWQPMKFVCKLEETAAEWLKYFRQGKEFSCQFFLPTRTKEGTISPYIQFTFDACSFVGWRVLQPPIFDAEYKDVGHLCEIKLICRKFTLSHEKYNESEKVGHRKTQDSLDFDNPTG